MTSASNTWLNPTELLGLSNFPCSSSPLPFKNGRPYAQYGSSLVAQMVKNLPAKQETQVQSLVQEDPLEDGMATHSTFLPGEFHGQGSLVGGYSSWGHKDSDTAEAIEHTI